MIDSSKQKIDINSSSVQGYLGFLQIIINRMAANCTGCKTWCVTIVSATTVIIAEKEKPDYVWISLIPLVLFFFLDAYYLGLERCFRALYNDFVNKLHASTATINDVYTLLLSSSLRTPLSSTTRAFTSLSIWPFYGLLATMLIIVRLWILTRPS